MSDVDRVLCFDEGETQTTATMARVMSFFNGGVVRLSFKERMGALL